MVGEALAVVVMKVDVRVDSESFVAALIGETLELELDGGGRDDGRGEKGESAHVHHCDVELRAEWSVSCINGSGKREWAHSWVSEVPAVMFRAAEVELLMCLYWMDGWNLRATMEFWQWRMLLKKW